MSSALFERVLVPTDLTDFTNAAIEHARLFQQRLGSSVTLLYANEVTWLVPGHRVGYYVDDIADRKQKLQRRLAAFAGRHCTEGLPMATRFVDDLPARAILSVADEIDAGLIIMDTHARHGIPRALLGSVTERVLRDTARPLMTVVPGAVPPAQLQAVLCPVNFTDAAGAALNEAAAIAEAFGARLIVMHVVEGRFPPAPYVSDVFARWIGPALRNRTSFEQIIIHGDPAECIAETAEATGASLIVVGSVHNLFKDVSVGGGATERIIRAASRPVLTVVGPRVAEWWKAA